MRVLVFCLLGFVLLQQSDGKQPKESDNSQKHGNKDHSEQQIVIFQNGINGDKSQIEQPDKAEQTPKNAHDLVDRINAASTAVIALFTILLFCGGVYQVTTTRGSERAWVVLQTVKPPEHLGWAKENIPDWLKSIEIEMTFKNTGRTPAILRNMSARCWITENPEDMPAPVYGTGQHPEIPKYGRILVPEETLETLVTFKGNINSPNDFSVDIRDVISGKTKIMIYGRIIYDDAFSRTQEFRFCYVWGSGQDRLANNFGFRLGGPPEYNKAT